MAKSKSKIKDIQAPAEKSGRELYEEYLSAKKAFAERIKAAVDYLARAGKLSVTPVDLRPQVVSKLTWATSHSWRYCEGHDKVYCTFMVGSYHGRTETVKVVVPLAALDESALDRELAIIDNKIAVFEQRREAARSKVEHEISLCDTEIDGLISMKKKLLEGKTDV